uniref:Uncharacterized protein n=1 Tax=Lepeophtheirus salmonis TaxID=72036 RepID=A0A0K2V9M4_LEPSM
MLPKIQEKRYRLLGRVHRTIRHSSTLLIANHLLSFNSSKYRCLSLTFSRFQDRY